MDKNTSDEQNYNLILRSSYITPIIEDNLDEENISIDTSMILNKISGINKLTTKLLCSIKKDYIPLDSFFWNPICAIDINDITNDNSSYLTNNYFNFFSRWLLLICNNTFMIIQFNNLLSCDIVSTTKIFELFGISEDLIVYNSNIMNSILNTHNYIEPSIKKILYSKILVNCCECKFSKIINRCELQICQCEEHNSGICTNHKCICINHCTCTCHKYSCSNCDSKCKEYSKLKCICPSSYNCNYLSYRCDCNCHLNYKVIILELNGYNGLIKTQLTPHYKEITNYCLDIYGIF